MCVVAYPYDENLGFIFVLASVDLVILPYVGEFCNSEFDD